MLGMPAMDGGGATEDGSAAGGEGSSSDGTSTEQPKKKKKFGLKDALDAVKDSRAALASPGRAAAMARDPVCPGARVSAFPSATGPAGLKAWLPRRASPTRR